MLDWRNAWHGVLALVVSGLCSAHESIDATLWMQTSAEYRVIVEQVFDQAQRRLPDALAASPSLGALENRADAAPKKPAIILDIDEAVLDNGPSQALAIIRGQRGFDPDAWDEWVMSHKADALPGALNYVRRALDLGIQVFYVTNRGCNSPADCPQKDATIRNLVDLGFPGVDDARLLMKNEHLDWTSEKSSRRAEIAKGFRIVQLVGDDLGDFIPGVRGADAETRRDMVARHQGRFGHTWHLLPNPLYGSWKKALGGSPVSHLQPDRERLCLGTPIPVGHIQGPGDSSHCTGLTVDTRGVVSLVSTGEGGLGGYFIQDTEGDGNSTTSDGIFVVDRENESGVAVGDFIEIRARVAERNGMTSLQPLAPDGVTLLGPGRSVGATFISLPESFDGELERYEGMLVSLDQSLTVTGNRGLGELGQIELASADEHGRPGRLYEPTHLAIPGSSEAERIKMENARRILVLDDTKGADPDPVPFIGEPDEHTTLRVGDQVADILGVLDYGEIAVSPSGAPRFDYRVQTVRPPSILPRNHRPAVPAAGGSDLRITSANLQGFFTDLDNGGCPRACEIYSYIECRGALDEAELRRQELKLMAALAPLDADIYGFQGVQNNGFGEDGAIARLTHLLGGEFDFIRAEGGHIGRDTIGVGLAYRNTVRPIGEAHVLSTGPFDPSWEGASQAPLAQVFEHKATGERFTIVVNKFKSRRAPDQDAGDTSSRDDNRQGHWNLQRTESARHLARWLETLGDEINPDILIMGDFNAQAYEDPLQALESAGYINLLKPVAGDQTPGYTQVQDGLTGALDQVLVSGGLVDKASAFTWAINADEPEVMDYRLRVPGTAWFHETPFRASGRDPVIVDLTFGGAQP